MHSLGEEEGQTEYEPCNPEVAIGGGGLSGVMGRDHNELEEPWLFPCQMREEHYVNYR